MRAYGFCTTISHLPSTAYALGHSELAGHLLAKLKKRIAVLVSAVLVGLLSFSCVTSTDQSYWPTKEWKSSPPGRQGMDPAKVRAIDSYIRETLPLTSSVLVARHGYIAFERYFARDRSDTWEIYSVTKSVLSALVGIAIDQGYLEGADQRLIEFFPENVSEKLNPQVTQIILRHLLTMSDGISKDDVNTCFTKNSLNNELRAEPGREFFFKSMSPQLLSTIITRTTGLKALDFAKKHLFEPLGISNVAWSDDWGFSNGAYGMLLSTPDLAKIGYLYLKGGIWDNKQVVSPEWIAESTRAHIETGRSSDQAWAYGYLWWVRPFRGHPGFVAYCPRCPSISVIPDLDLVVVITTSDPTDQGSEKYLSIIEDYVIPSIRK
jgi:CubicO group peptidase (beta-lactamase class C family)